MQKNSTSPMMNPKQDAQQWHSFVQTVSNGDEQVLKKLLDEQSMDPMVCNDYGVNVLHMAVWRGQVGCVKILIPYSDVNAVDLQGRSALMYAVEKRDMDCVKALIDHSVGNLEKTNVSGLNVLDVAAACNNVPILQLLLSYVPLGHKASVCGQALMSASAKGAVECVKVLLPLIDPAVSDLVGTNALMNAAGWGHAPVVKVLIEHFDPGAVNRFGQNALHMAAQEGAWDCAQLLLPHMDILAQDKKGLTALEHAAQNGQWECVKMLSAHEVYERRPQLLFVASQKALEKDQPQVGQWLQDLHCSIRERQTLGQSLSDASAAKKSVSSNKRLGL